VQHGTWLGLSRKKGKMGVLTNFWVTVKANDDHNRDFSSLVSTTDVPVSTIHSFCFPIISFFLSFLLSFLLSFFLSFFLLNREFEQAMAMTRMATTITTTTTTTAVVVMMMMMMMREKGRSRE
jgi:hypothetical protein